MAGNRPSRNGRQARDQIHLRDVWNLVFRNKLLIFACLAVVAGVTAWFTWQAVPVYQANTSIRVDADQSNLPALDVLQTLTEGSEVETEMVVLRSRTLAKEVVQGLGLQLAFPHPRGVARGELVRQVHVEPWAPSGSYSLVPSPNGRYRILRGDEEEVVGTTAIGEPAVLPGVTFTLQPGAAEHGALALQISSFMRATTDLQNSLEVARPNREAKVVTVRYESADTQLVYQVPNLLAREFIERRQEVQKTEARSTVEFLSEQIDTLRQQLDRAELALQEFRESEQVVSLEAEASAQVTQLANLQAERNQLDAEREALQRLLDEIRAEEALNPVEQGEPSPFRRLIAFPSLLRNQAASEPLRALNQIETQRTELLERRTPEDPEVQQLTRRIKELEEQLRAIATTYLDGLTKHVQSLDETLDRFGTQLERIPAKEVQMARLERQQNVLEQIYTVLQTRLREAQIAQAVEDASIRVVDPAEPPGPPIRPRKMLNLALGIILGLMVGVGVAFTRDYVDDTVHTREDMQDATEGAPVLGMIPRIREAGKLNGRGKRRPRRVSADGGEVAHLEARLVTGRDPRNPVAEAYRSLRTNITFSNPEAPPRTLVFTSPMPQDGKSTSAANLAITLAQQGIETVLIDADLRRGVLHHVFHQDREPGLSNVLAGQESLGETLRRVNLGESGSLGFLSTGTLPPNPAELLGSDRMRRLLERLEGDYEAVILDSPPLNVVTDAAVLGTNADGVILVARASSTAQGAIIYAVEQLNNVRAPILGSVLNDVDFRRDGRYSSRYGKYGYYYHYYYGKEGGRKRKATVS